jgi:hypothetical protein
MDLDDRHAPQAWGADKVVISRNANEMRKHTGSFDFIPDAVSAVHDINAYQPAQTET